MAMVLARYRATSVIVMHPLRCGPRKRNSLRCTRIYCVVFQVLAAILGCKHRIDSHLTGKETEFRRI